MLTAVLLYTDAFSRLNFTVCREEILDEQQVAQQHCYAVCHQLASLRFHRSRSILRSFQACYSMSIEDADEHSHVVVVNSGNLFSLSDFAKRAAVQTVRFFKIETFQVKVVCDEPQSHRERLLLCELDFCRSCHNLGLDLGNPPQFSEISLCAFH